ncbi:MAG TPA: Isoquinoline 1-oxidoreductase subunit [Xanthobacteraceae bacterium]
MRGSGLLKVGAAALIVGIAAATLCASQPTTAQPTAADAGLRPPSDFAGITDARARSVALFQEAGKVLQHPRCVNCHPAGDSPHQTDRMRLHQPLVVRGADGHGAPTLQCNTCHGPENFDPARVPGHPQWHVAPLSMAWEGRSLGQICEEIKDRSRNGNRDLAELLHHVSEDSLVGWAWSPGAGRAPAPGTQARFGEIMRAWVEAGAACPAP